ncbi:glycosyltransferase [Streptomyces sp. RS10V-4]|uniref:glycosyltransferase n=1 Tax=Streptomyces rhizoryzae TaxID=2932493 RepID=UPI0020053FA6|nr:glycosyltransferase [Streptomyces rhizoryzae]MCK7624453.1 glycosyltransferase [Streptomyces rhizoryzae]
MPLRIAITAEPIPSHVSALDFVLRPAREQGHHVALHAPLMFRGEARRRGVEFHPAGTDWSCERAVQQAASEIWRASGNAPFNRYVFGHLWPEQAAAKAADLLAAWTRARPDLVIAECSDLGAHLAATVLGLPLLAADNGLGPVLLDLWDTDIAPALLPLHKAHEQDTPALPPMLVPAPVPWFYGTPPPAARPVRRTLAEFRTVLPEWLDGAPSGRPLVYVSLGTLTTAMPGLRTVVGDAYREIMAALRGIDCDAIVSAGDLAGDLRSPDPRITLVGYAPQPALLRRADLFVTHGGRASLLDAVQGATPVLGLGVLADQPANTAAFARRGLGRALDLTATRGELADAMTDLLGTPGYRAALRAAGAELAQLPPLDLGDLRDGSGTRPGGRAPDRPRRPGPPRGGPGRCYPRRPAS